MKRVARMRGGMKGTRDLLTNLQLGRTTRQRLIEDRALWVRARWPKRTARECTKQGKRGTRRTCLERGRRKAQRCRHCVAEARLLVQYARLAPDPRRPVSAPEATGPCRVIRMTDGPRPRQWRPKRPKIDWNEVVWGR